MRLKSTLKTIKLNEPTISAILGALVILAAGVLLINYLKTRNIPELSLPPTTENKQTITLPTTHKVAKGEHLWNIAEKYYKSGYNWTDIAKANNLQNANVVSDGQELTIPQIEAKQGTVGQITNEAAQTEAPPTAVIETNTPDSIDGSEYKVEKGDSLWKISVRAYGDGYKWTQIWEANKKLIINPNKIFPDHNLTLPR